MSNQTIGFIGGGRVTRIFLEGWKRAGAMPDKSCSQRLQIRHALQPQNSVPQH